VERGRAGEGAECGPLWAADFGGLGDLRSLIAGLAHGPAM